MYMLIVNICTKASCRKGDRARPHSLSATLFTMQLIRVHMFNDDVNVPFIFSSQCLDLTTIPNINCIHYIQDTHTWISTFFSFLTLFAVI
jgi:hypothetical protein